MRKYSKLRDQIQSSLDDVDREDHALERYMWFTSQEAPGNTEKMKALEECRANLGGITGILEALLKEKGFYPEIVDVVVRTTSREIQSSAEKRAAVKQS